MKTDSPSLSNLQLELLKAFSHDLSESDLLALKKLLADFFANRAITEANRVWDQEKWDEEKINQLLQESKRTPYDKKD